MTAGNHSLREWYMKVVGLDMDDPSEGNGCDIFKVKSQVFYWNSYDIQCLLVEQTEIYKDIQWLIFIYMKHSLPDAFGCASDERGLALQAPWICKVAPVLRRHLCNFSSYLTFLCVYVHIYSSSLKESKETNEFLLVFCFLFKRRFNNWKRKGTRGTPYRIVSLSCLLAPDRCVSRVGTAGVLD